MCPVKYHQEEYFNTDIKSWTDDRLHVKEPHVAPEAWGSITSLKDTTIFYRQTGVSQMCPQLWGLGVEILPTRGTASKNTVVLFGNHYQIKAETKMECQKVGYV